MAHKYSNNYMIYIYSDNYIKHIYSNNYMIYIYSDNYIKHIYSNDLYNTHIFQ